MPSEMNRRRFVQNSVLASAGAALAANAVQTADAAAAAETTDFAAQMPTGKIGDMVISRLLLGGNLLTHYTHSRDLKYVYKLAEKYNTEEKILETLALAEEFGINTLVVHNVPKTIKILQKHRKRGGKMQWITCTFHALAGRGIQAFNEEIQQLVDAGTDAVYVSGVEADTLCGFTNPIWADNAGERATEPRHALLAEAVDMAKAHGLPTGLGAHRLGAIVDCEQKGIDVDFYLKTLHKHDYPSHGIQYDSSFCPEPQKVIEVMRTVEKPFIAYKVMAAGAIPANVAIPDAVHGGADFVLAGMFDFEIEEDAMIVREAYAKMDRPRPLRA
jgi:hypothetical protein